LRIKQVGPVSLRAFGRWGVLIFFVHTCLVLSYSLERNSAFWPFLARRVFRIYPLSVVVVLCVVALAIPVGFPGDHFSLPNREPSNVLLNLLLLQNISGGISVLAPLWSLPYEMQMYLLLPALFYLISRRIRFLEYLLWA
jgi:peptidoglycan/LPS O-acetylase OafA/YrhL